MDAQQFYNFVLEDLWIIGHSIALFLGFIFGILFWKELFK